ncbi:hypothetical protein M0R88_08180 [Halorussus gelatinilyticus]|uniref:Uncharacterized protein n=1 Tax=Halorussus gelatinilyticus TaxID=2937524 RepID=A0A8U0IPW6_9EURY|nr:hypothetical protein [Halorussus gelatinilyticus]UPW02059.1 hypothetical protein M0R88_08180 [Halorussus gelatinilyticus]
MQFDMQDQTEDASAETKPVAPGTSSGGACGFDISTSMYCDAGLDLLGGELL